MKARIIKKLDIFGQSVQLTFRKDPRFKSYTGALCSVIFFTVVGALICLNTIEFVNKIPNAVVNQSDTYL